MSERKTAFIAIVGRPNVGKSSILNRLLGEKIAIVSSKPQTTRTRIMGVLTDEDCQLVFIDTPGLHKPRNDLDRFMLRSINESVAGVDMCVLVTEAGKRISNEEEQLMAMKETNDFFANKSMQKKLEALKNLIVDNSYHDRFTKLYNGAQATSQSQINEMNMAVTFDPYSEK